MGCVTFGWFTTSPSQPRLAAIHLPAKSATGPLSSCYLPLPLRSGTLRRASRLASAVVPGARLRPARRSACLGADGVRASVNGAHCARFKQVTLDSTVLPLRTAHISGPIPEYGVAASLLENGATRFPSPRDSLRNPSEIPALARPGVGAQVCVRRCLGTRVLHQTLFACKMSQRKSPGPPIKARPGLGL
jgi:hypothetical protein